MILTKLNELVVDNQISSRQLTSRLNNLRSDHKIMSDILSLSGWGYDAETGISTTTEFGKATYVAAHPEAAKFMHKLMPGFEVLNSMWMGTHAIGTYATSDGSSRVTNQGSSSSSSSSSSKRKLDKMYSTGNNGFDYNSEDTNKKKHISSSRDRKSVV